MDFPTFIKTVPHTADVEVYEFKDVKNPLTVKGIQETGITLAELRRQLGTHDGGYVTNPILGTKHYVSLKPWKTADPNTRLAWGFKYVPKTPISPEQERIIEEMTGPYRGPL